MTVTEPHLHVKLACIHHLGYLASSYQGQILCTSYKHAFSSIKPSACLSTFSSKINVSNLTWSSARRSVTGALCKCPNDLAHTLILFHPQPCDYLHETECLSEENSSLVWTHCSFLMRGPVKQFSNLTGPLAKREALRPLRPSSWVPNREVGVE